ncbi:component of the polarisome [Marasmius tenuissimus]|nr:component of the polarisome [Marasmius tenuissimus]
MKHSLSAAAIGSFRPTRDSIVTSSLMPYIDYCGTLKTHFEEFSKYLVAYLSRATPSSRPSARKKFVSLTVPQLHELSTDVYDELIRRQHENEISFLPTSEGFHPQRNQAQQKLATLPRSRFEDLLSDVHYRIG